MVAYMISQISDAVTNLQHQQIPDVGFMALVLSIFISWLPKHVSMSDLWFKLCIFAIVLYQMYSLYMTFEVFSTFSELQSGGNPAGFLMKMISFQRYTVLLLPLTLLLVFCQGYMYYFCAKTLKSIELNKNVELGEYIAYFFLFMFDVVGFWIIQPSVNRITAGGWTPPPPPSFDPVVNTDPTFDPIESKEQHPKGELLRTKNHEAFEYDDDFEGLF